MEQVIVNREQQAAVQTQQLAGRPEVAPHQRAEAIDNGENAEEVQTPRFGHELENADYFEIEGDVEHHDADEANETFRQNNIIVEAAANETIEEQERVLNFKAME